ncbi:IPT/TIG domain-containing protein [Algoriphagus namhaensis]|uniref:IPT/TIG domain-containing protein n=1 Tax=Algoriphagus namhaensis TaxID=915353 RepID=A0ABV8AQP3_9BACT
MRRIIVLVSLVFLGFLQACEEEDPETTILITEEVLLTSGEQARLLGRLITNQAINPQDHGFYLSLDANFSSPIIVSLGPKEGPGRFIGEVTGLNIGQTYFARAFMDLGNGPEFGNTIELTTLIPGIDSYTPGFGEPGDEVFILGKNFTSDTRVFFGDQEAEVAEILFESRLRVIVPSAGNSSSVEIRVQSQDQVLTFPIAFEYQTGSYTKLANFPDEGVRLIDNIYHYKNGVFQIGLGSDRNLRFYEKIQQYDPNTNLWQEVNFSGSNRAFGFSTPNYIGGGIAVLSREPFTYNRSFWRNTPSGFVRLGDLPFDSYDQIAVELNGVLYLIGGGPQQGNAVWRYNSANDTWESIGVSPEPLSRRNVSFVYQNQLFVIGNSGTLLRVGSSMTDWQAISTFPGSLGQGFGFGEVIGIKAYIGGYSRSSEIWELNLQNLNWVSKNPIPGTAQGITAGSFAKDGFLYFMRQPDLNLTGSFPLEMYRFDPNGL